jgi:hypothetical protein
MKHRQEYNDSPFVADVPVTAGIVVVVLFVPDLGQLGGGRGAGHREAVA